MSGLASGPLRSRASRAAAKKVPRALRFSALFILDR
jgi:hypothetical protein